MVEVGNNFESIHDKPSAKDIDRRSFLRGLGIATAGIASLPLVGCGSENKSISEPGLVQNEITALNISGIVESEYEQSLWSSEPFVPVRVNSVEEAELEVRPKIGPLIDTMIDSSNPYFSESGLILRDLIVDGRLFVDFIAKTGTKNTMDTYPHTITSEGEVKHSINMYIDNLRGLDPQIVAVTLVHELVHIQDYEKLLQEIYATTTNLSMVADALTTETRDFAWCSTTEAIGYSKDALSYIYQKALNPSLFDKNSEEIANLFLEHGKDTNSSEWTSKIAIVSGCVR